MKIRIERKIKTRKSKIFLILLLCLSLFSIAGCSESGADGKEYSILYVSGNSILDLEPRTYISGVETKLPVLEDGFVGWYYNRDLTGDAIISIPSNENGNLIFYAKYEENGNQTQVGNNSLSKYVSNMTNYQYSFKYSEDGESIFDEKYYIDLDKVKVIYNDEYGYEYTEYVYKKDSSLVYLYDNGDGTYDEILESDADFSDFYDALYLLGFSELQDEDFSFENNCFTVKSDKVNNVGKVLLDDYEGEEFTEIKIFVEGNYITKISAKSKFNYYGEIINCTYEVILSNFNNVTITLPEGNGNVNAKEEVSISANFDTYTVTVGTGLEEVLGNLIIKLNYNDGTSINIDNGYTYSGNYNEDQKGKYTITIKYNGFECEIIIEVVEAIVEKPINEYINNMNNYQYVYSYNEEGYGGYESKVYVNGNASKFEIIDGNDIYYDYLYSDENGNLVYLYDNGDGIYDVIKESDSDFEESYAYLDIVYLDSINGEDYTFSNNCFTAKSNIVDEAASNLLGYFEDEVYSSLKIYVNESYITKITASSSYNYYGSEINCNYEVVFSNVGSTTVNLPNINGEEVEKTEVSISVNSININVLRGTTIDEVLEKVVVKLNYSDGTSINIENSECTFTHSYSPSILASYDVKVTYKNFECSFKINVLEEIDVYEVVDDTVVILEDILDEMGEYDGVVYGVTRGLSDNANVLVIPVEFTDYKADNRMVEALEKAFFGTSEETGWESLKSYYYKSSYGKCEINGTVLPVFSTGKSSKYYDSLDDDTAVNSIIKAALEYYDSSINYDEYDLNGDTYIDSIYLVYTAPIDYESDDSLYWAFSYQYFTDDYEYYDNVEADFYCFLGYDFLFEELACGKKVTYNAETIIHESGHLFGLDDYYDYDDTKGPEGGVGGGDMMDYNVGDHNAFSKMLLGWVTPSVIDANNITSDITVTLESFAKSGDCLVICNGWENSYFDEYFVIDFYTPDGLNSLEAGYSGLFSSSGIRIYHIDATLNSASNVSGVWDVYKYNNSDTSHKLIRLVQADGLDEIEKDNAYSENADLFQVNDKFINIKWYDNTNCKFEIIVDSISQDSAQITIKYLG